MLSLHRLLRGLAIALTLAVWSAVPARAQDDVSAAGRGVVRVVVIALDDDKEVIASGTGSGFAVAPNRIVTNAHVVDAAQRYPGNVVIGVVPSEGSKSYQGRLVAVDVARDLALIEFTGTSLPALTVYSPPLEDGASVIALGYPANVDLATARSAADFITPQTPVRSPGAFSGMRELQGTQMVLHTARIARGNSGGPLVDECGRVLGVNSALTRADDGDSGFAFAIADNELLAFLSEAKQTVATVDNRCVPLSEQERLRRDADDRAAADAAERQRLAAVEASARQDRALAAERDRVETASENYMFAAMVLLVLGAAGLAGAGLLATRNRRAPAIVAAIAGGLLIVAAVVCFFLRPSFDADKVKADDGADGNASASADVTGKLICTVVPEQSRITVSRPTDVPLEVDANGCVNGRTQYAAAGKGWERIFVPKEQQTVSVLAYDPATATYTNTRYLMSADGMDKARKLRDGVRLKSCSQDQAALAELSSQQNLIRQALPPRVNEVITYHCTPTP